MIVANLSENAKTAQAIIADAVGHLPIERTCECATALATGDATLLLVVAVPILVVETAVRLLR